MQDVVIISGARTPVGRFGGAFKDVSASQLGSLVIREALEQANILPDQVDEVVPGCRRFHMDGSCNRGQLHRGMGGRKSTYRFISTGIDYSFCPETDHQPAGL